MEPLNFLNKFFSFVNLAPVFKSAMMHLYSPNHWAQKRCLHYEKLAWRDNYLKYSSDQCSGDLALVSNDGYYAVPFCSVYHQSGSFALVAGEYGSIIKVPFIPKTPTTPLKVNFEAISDAIFDLQFCPTNNDELALACSDSYAYVMDLPTGKLTSSFNCEELVKRSRFIQSNLLVTGGASGKIETWDTNSHSRTSSINAHAISGKGSITSFQCINEYEIASIGTPDYRIKFWDLRSPRTPTKTIESICSKRERAYTALDYCGGYLYACNTNNIAFQFNKMGVVSKKFSAPNYTSFSFYTKLQLLKDSNTLVSSSGNGQIFLWDVNDDSAPLSSYIVMGTDQQQEITSFSECATRDELLIASEDGSIRIWNKTNNSTERAYLVSDNATNSSPLIAEEQHTDSSNDNTDQMDHIFWPLPSESNHLVRSFGPKECQSLISEYCESSNKRPRLK